MAQLFKRIKGKDVIKKVATAIMAITAIALLFVDAMFFLSVDGTDFFSVKRILQGALITSGIVIIVIAWFMLTD
jgi:hypothetical protein